MEKERYIEAEKLKLIESFTSLLLLLGIPAILSLAILDYFVTPENFTRFLAYRGIAVSLFMLLYFIAKLRRTRTFQLIIIAAAGLVVASMVELMIFSFGKHESIYYAGMIVIFAFMFGFLPLFSIKITVFLAAEIYAVYLLPLLLFDDITNTRVFLNNSIFLSATLVIGAAWRYYNDALLLKKLSLEYDLSQDRDQLQTYSSHLEDLVAERTKELSISEQRYRGLFENANDGIIVLDRKGVITNANRRFCELHGFEKGVLLGTNFRLLETENDEVKTRERMDRIMKGEALVFETQHYRKDGSRILLEVSSKALEIGGETLIQSFHRDITDKKRLQEQLFQSQKMESIGVLAGGIAHDFNNVLSAILGHAELLHEYGNLEAKERERVKLIETSARKAGQMVSRLLSFARKGNFEIVPINLNDVVKDTLDLVERILMKKNVELKRELDEALPLIDGDANQLEQVIMNLAVNAGDAMPQGGVLTVKTSKVSFEKDAAHIHSLLAPGKYVVLTVTDTGAGIPEEIRDRIFDPFFTTKGVGKGTGLGLAMVYGIVKEHGGVITVKSRMGKGTVFEIYLPASDKVVPKVERAPVYSKEGREKILVVDDEPEVLSFTKDILESQGYRVVATDNPVYAQEICGKIAGDMDLIITDIVMPFVNGRELIKHFKQKKPSIKVIAISGYDIWNIGKRDKDIDAYVRKPFEGIYLLSVVRRVLDSVGSASSR